MPANCREVVILQNQHGFLIFTRENVDPTIPGPSLSMADAIPQTELETSEYGSDPSVLKTVKKFFSQPKKETP